MDEQAKFNQWWESKGVNSVILRAQAWSAWLARAEADQQQPQPAEDTDEWVIQDRVPVRVGDRISWHYDNVEDSVEAGCFSVGAKHGDVSHGDRLRVWCRRRDLPKVEQAEQWPKYYKPSQPRKTGYGKHVAYYKCSETEKGETVHTDGTSFGFTVRAPGFDWTEITEAEAMSLLSRPTEPEPQPQKTRVRLWIPSVLNSSVRQNTVIVQHQPANPLLWQEIHYDSEGFYVEGGQT